MTTFYFLYEDTNTYHHGSQTSAYFPLKCFQMRKCVTLPHNQIWSTHAPTWGYMLHPNEYSCSTDASAWVYIYWPCSTDAPRSGHTYSSTHLFYSHSYECTNVLKLHLWVTYHGSPSPGTRLSRMSATTQGSSPRSLSLAMSRSLSPHQHHPNSVNISTPPPPPPHLS